MVSGNESKKLDEETLLHGGREPKRYSDEDNKDIDDWRSQPGWPKVLLDVPPILHKTVNLWIEKSKRITAFAWFPLPQSIEDVRRQYRCLTDDLVWYCDAGPSSIDPSPLLDYWDLVSDLVTHRWPSGRRCAGCLGPLLPATRSRKGQRRGQSKYTKKEKLHQQIHLLSADIEALTLVNRMIDVAYANANFVPPKLNKGRPKRALDPSLVGEKPDRWGVASPEDIPIEDRSALLRPSYIVEIGLGEKNRIPAEYLRDMMASKTMVAYWPKGKQRAIVNLRYVRQSAHEALRNPPSDENKSANQ